MKSITSNNSNSNNSNKRRRHRLFPKLFKSTKSKGISSSSTNGHRSKEECEHHHYEAAECDTPTPPTSFVYNNTTTPTHCSSRNYNNSNNNAATTALTTNASSTNNMMSITTSTTSTLTTRSTTTTTNNKLRILDLNNRAVSYYNNKGNCFCRGKAVSMFERMLLPELSSSTLMPFLSYLKTPLLTPSSSSSIISSENDYDYEMDNNDDDYNTYSSVFDTLSSTSIELLTLTHNLATMSRLDHNAKRANANNIKNNNNNNSRRNIAPRGTASAAAASSTGTTSTTAATQQQPSRTSYMYQRTDFDEGFRFYDDLQLITRNDNEEQMAAIILYNYGQMKRMEDSSSSHNNNSAVVVADALHYYEQSYEIVMEQQKQKSDDSTTTNLGLLSIPLLHNMGFIYYTTGKIDNAIMCYESVVQHSKKHHHLSASGGDNNADHAAADDISVGIALNCLSVLKYHQSDDCSNDTPRSNQPLNNEDTISSSSSDDCLKGFQEALKIISRSHVKTLPSSGGAENHPDIATILNNIGRVYVQRDEFDTALEYYKRALIIRSKTLGKDSLDYAATAFNVGQSLHKKGQLDEAMILYKEFLHVAKEKFQNNSNSNSGKSGGGCNNTNHRDIAVVLSGMAQIYQEQKEYTKSLELYKESLCVGRAALGEYHTEVASLLNRIGNFYFEIDDMDNALRCYKEGLCIDMVCLQDDTHPNMIITLSNMGEIYKHQKKYDYALRMYNQVLTRQRVRHAHTTGDDDNNTIDVDDDDQDESNKNRNKKINLPCHEDIASTLNAIGLIYDQMGDYKLSIKYLQDALRMRKKIFGDIPSSSCENNGDATINNPNHLDIASNLMNLGTTYYRKNFTTKALEAFNDAYRIRLNLLGKDNRDVVFVLYNIGLCYSSQCYYREAIDCFTETLRVEKLVLGTNHRDVAMTMYKLGQAYNAQGDFDHALANFKESLRIEQEQSETSLSNTTTYKESATTRARILNQIGNIYMARGDVVPMMDAFNDATRILRNAGLNPNSIINTVREQLLYAIDIPCPTAAPAA